METVTIRVGEFTIRPYDPLFTTPISVLCEKNFEFKRGGHTGEND